MLKVLIADDEKKVCRLIQMLCDWEKLNMELIGTAENGLEAIEMVEKYKPDILITDICMPGCDGIDVIRRARELNIHMEVIIISGYTEFKYAQQAIRYGVVEYLLKPIKKEELNASLKKLGERYLKEKERSENNTRLLQYMESDLQRRRYSLFLERILQKPGEKLSLEQMNEKYSYSLVQGIFRMVILKLDTLNRRISAPALERVKDALTEKLRAGISDLCEEFEIYTEGSVSYILCNYRESNSHQFHRALRNVADAINLKRFQLGDVLYTIAVGDKTTDHNSLDDSRQSALEAMRERLLEGCDKLLEAPRHKDGEDVSDLISNFNRNFDNSLELLDETLMETHINAFRKEIEKRKDLNGSEILGIVNSVGMHAVMVGRLDEKREGIRKLNSEIEDCCTMDILFAYLKKLLCGMIREKKEKHQDEERKPVRMAKQYLMNHYMEPVTLELVADYVGFNSSYFSVIFKKETGAGFGEYLTNLRMEKAKELLKNTQENIKDICIEVGYKDLKHFNAVFKKTTGLKPGEFRKLYG